MKDNKAEATIYRVNGDIEKVQVPDSIQSFDEIKKLMKWPPHTLVEVVYMDADIMLIDENGKVSGYENIMNAQATRVALKYINAFDYIAGDAMVLPFNAMAKDDLEEDNG